VEFGQILADYVKSVTLDKVPRRDTEVAKLAILDQVGVALAGVGAHPGVKVQALVGRCTANEATVLGTSRKTSTWLAALVNGTLGHTLDFDDCSSFGHPSVVLVPAMLATGETQDRSGREVVAVKLRRLPATAGDARTIQGHDRLDVMSDAQYGDATRYWNVADANTELEAEELTRTAGRIIAVPRS